VVHDRDVAVVVHPQRDIDRAEAIPTDLGLECVLVLETDIHRD
jgi:hypothetical protein